MRKYFSVFSLLFFGCTASVNVIQQNKETSNNGLLPIEGKLYASLYQQRSAEYKALCLQAYNMATLRLNNYISKSNLPKAIVTDIDETVLDNSPYAVHRALKGKEYEPQSWYEWTQKAEADSVPGAPAFLKYASSKGVEIFYITNREERERFSTITNLQKFGLPNADSTHLLLKSTTSGKEPRRQSVAAQYEIMMLLGDNLADFSSLFDKKTSEDRNTYVDLAHEDFGKRFIIIPNPGYGDWEGAMLKYNYKLSSAQKDSVYRTILKGY